MARLLRVEPEQLFSVPFVRCPECGGRILAFVDAWDEQRGRPEREGIYLLCEREPDPSNPEHSRVTEHSILKSAWSETTRAIEWWAQQRVRVKDAEPAGALR